jgi:hypothetical protein
LSDLPIAQDTAGRHLAAVRAATAEVGVPAHAAAQAAAHTAAHATAHATEQGGGETC